MLSSSFNLKDLGGDYQKLFSALKSNQNVSVFGMGQMERILSCVSWQGKVLYITADFLSASKVYDEFKSILGEKEVYILPDGTDIIYYKKAKTLDNCIKRIKVLDAVCSDKVKVIVSSVSSLAYYFPKKEDFLNYTLSFKVGDEIDLEKVVKSLLSMGYKREPLVTEIGTFSLRGFILDVFPPNQSFPSRIELFDTEIESINLFDPEVQSVGEVQKEVKICPFSNVLLSDKEVKQLINSLDKLDGLEFVSRDEKEKFMLLKEELKEKLTCGDNSFNLDFIFPLIEKKLASIFDYLSKDFLIAFDESKVVYDALSAFYTELSSRKKEAIGYGDSLPTNTLGVLTKAKLLGFFNNFTKLAFQKITSANKFFDPSAVFSFKGTPTLKYVHSQSDFVRDLNYFIDNDYKILIFAGSKQNAEKLKSRLEKQDVYLKLVQEAFLKGNLSGIVPSFISNGFILNKEKVAIIGTYDIFPKEKPKTDMFKHKRSVFSVPSVGDFVVHRIHGIGKFEGITKLSGNFGTKDFFVVAYQGVDKLYVPIDQMDYLDNYAGAGAPKRLSKIGGSDFGAVKQRVKKQIKEMAFSLINLYKEREEKRGHTYPKDDDLVEDFENSFPYTETEDQLIATSEIKQDMEQGKVMDRLVCGDVGFGKTEVALRAAFKTIVGGKQVAFIAPTTLLARQHFNTAKSRLGKFGVKIESLDRFKTQKQVEKILLDLKSHRIDMVCGTHRVLSNDVAFEDLGLVILDEEQKFGVEHKEKIKLDNKNVNVLTLSATPIPRTLHMSLSGIRDISVINTPPKDRLPVQTFLVEYGENLVKDAINRELNRGGQVFIVYNKVESIYDYSAKIRKLVPNANVVVGHGKLSGRELEDVVYKFYTGEANVLICTTIIENGIDLPNANTLIVVDSDHFGLSQLYQIRGRVGRGQREGFAYFTYKANKVLTEESYKRLEAIVEYTELGSGFKIALKDLEIRGSGNVFGKEQHGHIEKVGYELYSKMLKDAVLELKGEKIKEETEVTMKVGLDAYIPDTYITSSEERMNLYKAISNINSSEEKEELLGALIENYNSIPSEVVSLIEIAYTKNLAKGFMIEEIVVTTGDVKILLSNDDKSVVSEKMASAINKFSNNCVLFLSGQPIIKFKNLKSKTIENLVLVQEFLKALN